MPEPVRAIAKPGLRSPAPLSAGGRAGFHPRWRINKTKGNKSFLSRPVRLMSLLVNLSAAMKSVTCTQVQTVLDTAELDGDMTDQAASL